MVKQERALHEQIDIALAMVRLSEQPDEDAAETAKAA